jgi:hypothetical protein
MTNQAGVCRGNDCPNFRDEPKQCALLVGNGLSGLLNPATPCREGLLRHIRRLAESVVRRSPGHWPVSADDLVQETLSKMLNYGPWLGSPEAFVYGYIPKVLQTHSLRQSTGQRKEARRCGTCAFGAKKQKYGAIEVHCLHPHARTSGKTVAFRLPVLPSCVGSTGKTRSRRHGCSTVVYAKRQGSICGTCANDNCGHRKAGAKMVHWDPTPDALGCDFHTFPATDAEVNSSRMYTFEAGPSSARDVDVVELLDEAQDFVRERCAHCKTIGEIAQVLRGLMRQTGIACEEETVEKLAETLFRLLEIVRKQEITLSEK